MAAWMIEDRAYQTAAVESIFGYFMRSAGNPVIAMPTATGKSIVIARFLQRTFSYYPKTRVMVLTHVKELIEQNAAQMARLWPSAPIGVFSAGLGQRDTVLPIIFGGVKSVANAVGKFGWRDLLLVDEAHLISPKANTTYQQVITEFRDINPQLKVIGFTATNFRLGFGLLTDEGGVFTDTCYDLTTIEAFNRLIAEGYLAPLYPRKMREELDVSNVGLSNGEFAAGELQEAVDKEAITHAALKEACEIAGDRKSWLVFCSGIDHAEHVSNKLNSFGVSCAAIHSKISKAERDQRIGAFRAGHLRALSNNNVLTTGFDHPPIDLIVMLRPTMSPGLWVQMLGRGMRPAPDKKDCLVLDFAGNTRRLGPINDPAIPNRKGKGKGEVPVKLCDACQTFNHIRATVCMCCGEEFIFEVKITHIASTAQLIRSETPEVQYFQVQRVAYSKHLKIGRPPSMKVTYFCNLHMFHEWVFFEQASDHVIYGSKFPTAKAHKWWRQRDPTWPEELPADTDQALRLASRLKVPTQIRVWINKRYPEVLGYDFT